MLLRPIPDWMTRRDPRPDEADAGTHARGLHRGLHHFVRLIAALSAEPPSRRGDWLAARDPRAKVFACVALAVTATLLTSIPALVWALGISLLLMLSSGVPLRRFLAFASVPATFTLVMALPAGLNLVTPGAPLLRLCSLPAGPWGWWVIPSELTVTHQGVLVAARFSLRVLAAIAATFVLVATTRPDRLWFGLRGLGVPSVFVVLLSMMYRYLDLLARVGVEMHLARFSRTVGRLPPREDRRWFAASVTTLFRRTRSLAEQVHHAMWSRGYTGGVRLFHSSAWRLPDTLLAGGVAVACLILMRLP